MDKPPFMTTHLPGGKPHSEPMKKGFRDAILVGICRRCGYAASHLAPQDCIDFLRDRIADLSGKAKGMASAE